MQRDQRQATTTSAPATLGDKNRVKLVKALGRLQDGQALHELPNGQFKFTGNKFVPEHVAHRLLTLCGEPYRNNLGWMVYRIKPSLLNPSFGRLILTQ